MVSGQTQNNFAEVTLEQKRLKRSLITEELHAVVMQEFLSKLSIQFAKAKRKLLPVQASLNLREEPKVLTDH